MGMLLISLLLIMYSVISALPLHGSEGIATPPTASPRTTHSSLPRVHSATTGSDSSIALAPSVSSVRNPLNSYATPPILHHRHHHRQHLHHEKISNSAPGPSHPPAYSLQGPSVSPTRPPSPSATSDSAAPAPSPRIPLKQLRKPMLNPRGSTLHNNQPPTPQVFSLPLPPLNEDCTSVTCTDPLTYTPSGSPCGCVWPIQVRLSLDVALYKFFPLVSELANEIAASVSLYPHQVRITGANAANEQPEKTIILINLVPLGENFDHATAYSIYMKFCNKQVYIMTALFGAYEVLHVEYPGLPSAPSTFSNINAIYGVPYPGNGNNGMAIKPTGADVPRQKRDGNSGLTVAIISLISSIAFVACMGVVWILLLRNRDSLDQTEQISSNLVTTPRKPSGGAGSVTSGHRTSLTPKILGPSIQGYTAKTFSAEDIRRATENFDDSKILGEGGFGVVYSGILDDGRKVAVKVLKRDDHQGGREFLAEVEMLSRLHHRNLVKLIGICVEDHNRCLVYDIVPNGSVESHLHEIDRAESLGWGARVKIALGAARALAYLHEDSCPCVIHRDFKSSNILLEHDFTPKVSDFGLARTAVDEGNKHISTHVMGTFGYLAPEYAMTGHLLVKSDVYSYGVVLLELMTGRKPVDFSQPPGQENLVAWARPLLTSKEGLEAIADPVIRSTTALSSIAKIAAIASMCVQPEVSNRPFMGEVVQALKLVADEFDETKGEGSSKCNQDNFSMEIDRKVDCASGELLKVPHPHHKGPSTCYNAKGAMSPTDSKTLAEYEGWDFGSSERRFRSGPLRSERRTKFWERLKELPKGSMSEHSFSYKLPLGSH